MSVVCGRRVPTLVNGTMTHSRFVRILSPFQNGDGVIDRAEFYYLVEFIFVMSFVKAAQAAHHHQQQQQQQGGNGSTSSPAVREAVHVYLEASYSEAVQRHKVSQ